MLGIRPVLGRTFTKEEDGPNAVARRRDRVRAVADAVRRVARRRGPNDSLNSVPYTIIGVLPREADFPGNTQFWVPLNGDPNQQGQSYGYEGIGPPEARRHRRAGARGSRCARTRRSGRRRTPRTS